MAMLLACSGRSGARVVAAIDAVARTEVPLQLSLGSADGFVFFQITVASHDDIFIHSHKAWSSLVA